MKSHRFSSIMCIVPALFVLIVLIVSSGCLSVYHEKFVRTTELQYQKLDKTVRIPIYEADFPQLELLGRLQAGYEGTDEEIAERLAKRARKIGANVIINYREKEKEVTFTHEVPERVRYQTMRRLVRRRNPDGSESLQEELVRVPVFEPGYTVQSKENVRLIQCDFAWCDDITELPGNIIELSHLPKRFDAAAVQNSG